MATQAAVWYYQRQGYTWLGVDTWAMCGGSELGTNFMLPNIDMSAVVAKFQQHGLQGFMMIGGLRGYMRLPSLLLEAAQEHYPVFHISMVHLPMTISNNVLLNEFSLGSDTSLNALVDMYDTIKQSTSASRNCVLVVETRGGLWVHRDARRASGEFVCRWRVLANKGGGAV